MNIGQTYFTQIMNKWKKRTRKVPQFETSSRTNLCGRYHPTNNEMQRPPNGNNICAVKSSRQLNSGLSNNFKPGIYPNEKEQNNPITKHVTVTMPAAFFRVICNSSWKNDVATSCSDIVEVKAAIASNI